MNFKTVVGICVTIVLSIDVASASGRRDRDGKESGVRMRRVLERCTDGYGRRGVCKPPCLCDDEYSEQNTCANRKVCCVEKQNCEKAKKDACLIYGTLPGLCLPDCNYEAYLELENQHGDCAYGLYCCNPYIQTYYDYYKEYEPPKGIGRACESESGDGVCSPKCGYGTFDGGDNSYCKEDLHCCVIDYRPPLGATCGNTNSLGHYGPAHCTGSYYCKDDEPSNKECFGGITCCKDLPLHGEPCDRGNGYYGTCIFLSEDCEDQETITTCAKGCKCC